MTSPDQAIADVKSYLLRNALPLGTLIAFIALVLADRIEMVYLNFAFYAVLFLYFLVLKEYSFGHWARELQAKRFWKETLATVVVVVVGFGLMIGLQNLFPQFALGEIKIPANTPFTIFLFSVQTIVLPPLAEEVFFRKSLISLKSRRLMAVTLVVSSLLFASVHAVAPFGIVTWAFVGLAFGSAYLWHKNVYALMTAHFITNVVANGIPLAIQLLTN